MSEESTQRQAVRRAMRHLISNNIGCRQRVEMMMEAVSVAHDFTEQRQATRLGEVVTAAENLEGPSKISEAQLASLRGFVKMLSTTMASRLASTMHASAIILTHSHIDDSLNKLLMVCVIHDVTILKDEIFDSCQTRYTLREIEKLDSLKTMIDASQQFLVRQKHVEVTKRSALLLRHLGKYGKDVTERRMKPSALESFDKTRHSLIHENVLVQGKFDQMAEEQCMAVIRHVSNLLQSTAEWAGLSWDELNELDDEPSSE